MTSRFQTLQAKHEALLQQQEAGEEILTAVHAYIEEVRQESRSISVPRERDQLRAILRYWSGYVYARTGTYPETSLPPASTRPEEPGLESLEKGLPAETPKQRKRSWKILLGGFAILLLLGMVLWLSNGFFRSSDPFIPLDPENILTIETESIGRIRGIGQVTVSEGGILDLAFSADSRQLAAAGADGTLTLWSMPDLVRVAALESGQTWWLQTVAFSSDGRWLASGGNDRVVRIWALPDLPLFAQLEGHQGFVFSIAFSPDSTTLASGGSDGVVKLWQVSTGVEANSAQIGRSALRGVAFSPDGASLAVAGLEEGAYILNLPDLSERCRYTAHAISAIAHSPVEALVAAGSQDGQIILLDTRSCRPLATLQPHSDAVTGIAFKSTGEMFVSSSQDNGVAVGPPVSLLNGHTASVGAIAFSPDGKLIASGDESGVIILWGIEE